MADSLLGDIIFTPITSPTSQDETYKATFPEHDKVQGNPTLQETGRELDTIKVALRFNWQHCDPDALKAQIMAAHKARKALSYVAGGQYKGRFVIEEVTSRTLRTNNAGQALTIELNLSLKEWATASALRKEKEVEPNPFKKTPTTLSPTGEILDPRDAR